MLEVQNVKKLAFVLSKELVFTPLNAGVYHRLFNSDAVYHNYQSQL